MRFNKYLKKLGDVSEVINGGTPKTKIKEYWGGEVAWITPADLGKLESVEVYNTSRTITELGLEKSSAKLFPPDSVILSTRAPIGHLAINKVPMSTNQGCRGIVPSNGLNTKYLYYFLLSNVSLLNDLGTGTTFKELSSKNLSSVRIPVPPQQEQKQIVSILDKAFAAIDQAKANIEKNIQNAEELFQSKLNEVFSQKGEGWEYKTLNEVSDNLDKKRIPITKKLREKGDIPYYGASGIVDYVKDYIFDEDILLISEDGANLLARTYPIAFSVYGKSWVNNHAHVLKFKNHTSQKFVEYYINSIKIDSYVSGMAQPKLNQKSLNSIPVPWPPITTQSNIVNVVEGLKTELKSLSTIYSAKLNSLSELRKSTLQKAFLGELTSTKEIIEQAESAV